MKRGEVWWVNFDPSIGGEIQKKRPATIVSNETSNKYLNRVQVVRLISSTDRVYPREALIHYGGQQSKAMADQLTTVSKLRLLNQAGKISPVDLQKVGGAIKTQLGITD